MPRNYKAKTSHKAMGSWSPEKRAAFLEALSTGISMAGAARACGMSHGFIYDLKAKDRAFSDAIDKCREAGSDRMEDALLSLGVRDKSVTALIFLLNGRRPEVYRQRVSNDLSNSDGSLAGLFAEAMLTGASPSHGNAGNGHDRHADSPTTPR